MDFSSPNAVSLVPLGQTGIHITRVGVGTWQWGDRHLWGYGQSHNDLNIQEAFQVSIQAGINWFDTAEVYGTGRSERLLGQNIRSLPEEQRPLVATKFFPFPWRFTK